jgi:pyruvate ferredoxin oxidoreductase alpha subunit
MSSERIGLEGSFAIAEAVKLARTNVVAAYPITPQTHIVERLADLVANGELDAEYVPVESEHSAMSACLGSSAVGARTFTATAGQGLELMHEVLYVAASSRLPIVMTVANRALSGPLSVWGDHSDAMAVRDVGWIQMFAENVQQAFDLVLCAFHIAEDHSVLIPTMVHIDGFHLSHMIEPLYLLEQEKVDEFLPEYTYPYALNPNKPLTIGAFGPPAIYTEAKKPQDDALRASKDVILRVWEKYGKLTGRQYKPVESYRTEDADVLLLAMGSYSETAMLAIDKMKDEGKKVGLIHLRLWRPFPFDELYKAISKAKLVIVLDRAVSYGGPKGIVCSEVQAAVHQQQSNTKVLGFIGGLGGRDMTPALFETLILKGINKVEQNKLGELEMLEVRE